MIYEDVLKKIKFDDKGLVPAVVQDFYTGQVLTVAYMNEESLKISLEEKMTCFWSRSRQELWRKGETSGNRQHIISITADCDYDALVVKVIKDGPACHTGSESCFFEALYQDDDKAEFSMDGLYALLTGRKEKMPEGSYTTHLFTKGVNKIAQKVGEEAVETVIEATTCNRDRYIYEVSDLIYHLLVLNEQMGVTLHDLEEELIQRHK